MNAFAPSGFGAGLAWYDFICPFCYIGQQRTLILMDAGLSIAELPFQAHPEIPLEGVAAGPRNGPMYAFLKREAEDLGLPLHWPARLPNSRLALTAAEWVRRTDPHRFPAFRTTVFNAHFGLCDDIGDPMLIDDQLVGAGIDPAPFWEAIEDGSAAQSVAEAEAKGRALGVTSTPAWFLGGRLISGLRPRREFERFAARQQAALV